MLLDRRLQTSFPASGTLGAFCLLCAICLPNHRMEESATRTPAARSLASGMTVDASRFPSSTPHRRREARQPANWVSEQTSTDIDAFRRPRVVDSISGSECWVSCRASTARRRCCWRTAHTHAQLVLPPGEHVYDRQVSRLWNQACTTTVLFHDPATALSLVASPRCKHSPSKSSVVAPRSKSATRSSQPSALGSPAEQVLFRQQRRSSCHPRPIRTTLSTACRSRNHH